MSLGLDLLLLSRPEGLSCHDNINRVLKFPSDFISLKRPRSLKSRHTCLKRPVDARGYWICVKGASNNLLRAPIPDLRCSTYDSIRLRFPARSRFWLPVLATAFSRARKNRGQPLRNFSSGFSILIGDRRPCEPARCRKSVPAGAR